MTAVRTSVVILIALLIGSMCPAAPVGANVDQCAPPSAGALPTNLAKAATVRARTGTRRRRSGR